MKIKRFKMLFTHYFDKKDRVVEACHHSVINHSLVKPFVIKNDEWEKDF